MWLAVIILEIGGSLKSLLSLGQVVVMELISDISWGGGLSDPIFTLGRVATLVSVYQSPLGY